MNRPTPASVQITRTSGAPTTSVSLNPASTLTWLLQIQCFSFCSSYSELSYSLLSFTCCSLKPSESSGLKRSHLPVEPCSVRKRTSRDNGADSRLLFNKIDLPTNACPGAQVLADEITALHEQNCEMHSLMIEEHKANTEHLEALTSSTCCKRLVDQEACNRIIATD